MICREQFLYNLFKYKRKIKDILIKSSNHERKFSSSISINSKKPKILFFGTDNFSLPSLKKLHENFKANLGTVTSFKSPANCVRQYAEQQNLPLYKWPINTNICKEYELGVVVSFGHLIPENVIKALPLGMINVHASLLPRWRGAAPIIYALMNGDRETGVSIMKIEPKHFDIGDILAQARVPIEENCFMPALHSILANKGANLLLDVVNNYPEKLRQAQRQDSNLVTYAPKITADITEISWSKLTARQLYDRYRALYGFKCLNTRFKDKTVQLVEIRLPVIREVETILKDFKTPGSFTYLRHKKCLLVRCLENSFIEIHQLRIEGKKIMSAQDFNNGFLKKLKNSDIYFVTDNKNVAVC